MIFKVGQRLVYLFFVFNNLSIVTSIPILVTLVFLFFILKVSSRENMKELNKSLDNISSIDVLR